MAKTGRGGRRTQKLNRAAASSSSSSSPAPQSTQPIVRTLPDDIITEILLRTPVKSLIRFRSVCKSWLLRTLHPRFISLHLKHNTLCNNKHLMCHTFYDDLVTKTNLQLIAYLSYFEPMVPVYSIHDYKSVKKVCDARKIMFSEFSKEMVLAGSINGVVCLSQQDAEMRGRFVALWNPGISQWKLIRVPGLKSCCDRLCDASVGLGFDEAKDDYKIIRIVPVVREPDFKEHCWSRVEIYSADSDSWEDVGGKDDGFVRFWPKLPNCNFIIKGCPYWVGVDRPDDMRPYEPMQKHEFLGMFDPCTGSFKKVLYPEYVKNESTFVHPLNWKDSLALLVQSPGEHPSLIVDMYRLDEKNGSWTKIHTMGPYVCFEGEYGFRIPQSLTTGEIVIEIWKGVFFKAARTPYFWDPKISDSLMYKSEFDTLSPLWYESYNHVESLVRVKGMKLIGKEDRKKKGTQPAKNWTELLSKDFESLLHLN